MDLIELQAGQPQAPQAARQRLRQAAAQHAPRVGEEFGGYDMLVRIGGRKAAQQLL